MIQQRNIAVYIVLTIVTCGIFGLYWMICLNDETNTVSQEPQPTSGGMVVLLSIVTLGIYALYWNYKQGEKLDRAENAATQSSRPLLYLILSFFGLGIVSYALMQDTLNGIVAANPAYSQPQQQPYQGQPQYGQPYQQQPYQGQTYQQQPYQGQPYQGQPQQPQYSQPQQPWPQDNGQQPPQA